MECLREKLSSWCAGKNQHSGSCAHSRHLLRQKRRRWKKKKPLDESGRASAVEESAARRDTMLERYGKGTHALCKECGRKIFITEAEVTQRDGKQWVELTCKSP